MDLINAANVINAESLKTNESGSEDDDNDETNDGSDTSRVVDSAIIYARDCLRTENYTEATIALRSVLEISEPTTTSYKMVVLHTAQLLKATQELKASIDCMLSVYRAMPPPLSTIDGICIIARSYEQLQSTSMARFWWKKLNPSLGDPIKPDARLWEAMAAKKSSELDEHSPMKRRFSVVKRLRAKRSSVDPPTERPSSAGAEEISSDEDQIMTRSCSTSLLDVYPLKIPGTEDFISTCGREPGFADLDLDKVGEFARLAHYRARVLTGKHASVNNLDTTKVKPQWLQDLERAVRFIETHQQRNLASGKVVIEGDSVAHLSEVHTRLVLQITTLSRLYTGDYGETSFTRRLGRITRKLVEWKFTRISEVIAALNDAKFIATQEEKQRNLEFYHVHRT
ncbi:hypothetical protein PC118_g2585 [Phytophthora cactorum]|uniref:Uncharacterized protein n=1 Tax=Phytophthora cactorum TaxID=29920 RepID=A0A8T1GUD8_9STRA|nr:hypothetical protein PC118_g2585 [Phytophthora cactorum]